MYYKSINKVSNTHSISKNYLDDRRLAYSIIFQFCMIITNYAVKEVFQITNHSTRSLVSLLFMTVVGLLYIRSLSVVLKRIGLFFVSTYVFFGTIFIATALIHPNNVAHLIDISFWFFLICLPTALYYLAIRDKTILLNMLILSGYYQMALGLIIFINMLINTPAYDMTFSYLLLTPIVIITYKLIFIRYKSIDLMLIIFGISAILTVGSRGPLLAYLIYLIILVFDYFKNNRINFKAIVIIIVTLVLMVILIIISDQLLIFLNENLMKFNIQSRTLLILMTNNIDFSTGRSEIFERIMYYITQKPILGYGIAGDRIILNGTYPHNILLEILVQFGVVLGGLIIILSLSYWIMGLVITKNKSEHHLAIIFIGLGLINLFYTGSYLTSSNYWLFISICISSVHFKKSFINTVTNTCNKEEL